MKAIVAQAILAIALAELVLAPVAWAVECTGYSGPAWVCSDTHQIPDQLDPPNYIELPNATKTLTGHGTATITQTDICSNNAGGIPCIGTDGKLSSDILPAGTGTETNTLNGIEGIAFSTGTETASATVTNTNTITDTATATVDTTASLTGTATATCLSATRTGLATGTAAGTVTSVWPPSPSTWTAQGTGTRTVTLTASGTLAQVVTGSAYSTVTTTLTESNTVGKIDTAAVLGTVTHTTAQTGTGSGVVTITTTVTATGTQTVTEAKTANAMGFATVTFNGTWTMTTTATGTGTMLYASTWTERGESISATYMVGAPNGDVYAAVDSGDIYVRAGGTGNFSALSQTSRAWRGMAAASNGDIYAAVSNGDIYIRSGGTGNFSALSQTSRLWTGMTAARNGDVYAAVDGGDIYVREGGVGNFTALGQASRAWKGMATAPNGDVYAAVSGGVVGDIYVRYGGTGNFIELSQTPRWWTGMAAAPNGDIYATEDAGVYVRVAGSGAFTSLGIGDIRRSIAVGANGDVYASKIYPYSNLFLRTGGTTIWSGSAGLSATVTATGTRSDTDTLTGTGTSTATGSITGSMTRTETQTATETATNTLTASSATVASNPTIMYTEKCTAMPTAGKCPKATGTGTHISTGWLDTGTGTGQLVTGEDPRLINERTPTGVLVCDHGIKCTETTGTGTDTGTSTGTYTEVGAAVAVSLKNSPKVFVSPFSVDETVGVDNTSASGWTKILTHNVAENAASGDTWQSLVTAVATLSVGAGSVCRTKLTYKDFFSQIGSIQTVTYAGSSSGYAQIVNTGWAVGSYGSSLTKVVELWLTNVTGSCQAVSMQHQISVITIPSYAPPAE